MSDIRLSEAELYDVTGYKRAGDQAALIREKYGIVAFVNAANEAVVIRAHLEAAKTPVQGQRPVRQVRQPA